MSHRLCWAIFSDTLEMRKHENFSDIQKFEKKIDQKAILMRFSELDQFSEIFV